MIPDFIKKEFNNRWRHHESIQEWFGWVLILPHRDGDNLIQTVQPKNKTEKS